MHNFKFVYLTSFYNYILLNFLLCCTTQFFVMDRELVFLLIFYCGEYATLLLRVEIHVAILNRCLCTRCTFACHVSQTHVISLNNILFSVHLCTLVCFFICDSNTSYLHVSMQFSIYKNIISIRHIHFTFQLNHHYILFVL